MTFEPVYLALARSGELTRRVEQAYLHPASCDLCPQNCRVDRHTAPRWSETVEQEL